MKAQLTSALALATVLAAAATGVALAETAEEPVHACVHDTTGDLRIADTCKNSETELTWNRTGPQGPAGEAGATGPEGATGPQGPPGPPATEPVTYLGQYALFAEGRYLGPLHSVEGCAARTEVVEHRSVGPDGQPVVQQLPGHQGHDDCWVEAGLGLDPWFYEWLTQSLADPAGERAPTVVAKVVDGAVTSAVGLEDTWPSGIGLTPVVGGSDAPVFLRVRLTFDDATELDLAGDPVSPMEEHPIDTATLLVEADGAPVAVDLVRGLGQSFKIHEARTVDQSGNTVVSKLPGDLSSGPLTVGAPADAGAGYLHAWYDALAAGDPGAFRAVRLALATADGTHTLEVEIPNAWPSESEPFPRLDGRTRAILALDGWGLSVS